MKITSFLLLGIVIGILSCSEPKSGQTDTYNTGSITIAADESYKPIIDQELEVFGNSYPKTKVILKTTSQQEALNLLFKDSVRVIIANREFTPAELAEIKEKRKGTRGKSIKIAEDAVAVVVNLANKDSLLSMDDLKGILSGTITEWSQIDGSNKSGKIVPVFDNPNSSNLYTMAEKLKLNVEKLQASIYSSGGQAAVIDYVNTHQNAIGFIGVNWIIDQDSPTQMDFNRKIRVASIKSKATDSAGYQPYQAYLKTDFYPLERSMYALTLEARQGLGSSFINWLTSDTGQRIILKAGLLPANAPIRVIELSKDDPTTVKKER